MSEHDIAIVGAGAAGLMAAIFAARAGARVIALDGAKRIGAKILIAGGGRCNVTHDVVRPDDFIGNRNIIAKVLRSFDVHQTIEFFHEAGVVLKREETGKLFPVTDRAQPSSMRCCGQLPMPVPLSPAIIASPASAATPRSRSRRRRDRSWRSE